VSRPRPVVVPAELRGAVERAGARLGAAARRDVPLGVRTTYRVGGAAALAVEPASTEELLAVARVVRASGVPVLVVGRGSNLLVADAGFPGLAVLVAEGFGDVVIAGTLVTAGGGASLPRVARRTAAEALTGFEWAVGVPGSIGGAVRMNAGGHGSDMAASLERVRVVDLEQGTISWLPAGALDLGYRRSNLGSAQVVVAAELRCAVGDRATAEALIADIVRWRLDNQPGGRNAGSVFSNPVGDSAGRLVDAAGLKGLRIGTAEVSSKHANFIQVDDDGSADDVKSLIDEVRRRVLEHSGVELRTEIRLVGFPATYPLAMESGGGRHD